MSSSSSLPERQAWPPIKHLGLTPVIGPVDGEETNIPNTKHLRPLKEPSHTFLIHFRAACQIFKVLLFGSKSFCSKSKSIYIYISGILFKKVLNVKRKHHISTNAPVPPSPPSAWAAWELPCSRFWKAEVKRSRIVGHPAEPSDRASEPNRLPDIPA